MSKMELIQTPDYCFAALKLIEQLYRDGKIPNYLFHNILSEYADVVDESQFIKGNHNQREECPCTTESSESEKL